MVTFSVNGIYTISYTDVVKGTISIPKDSIVTNEVDITLIGKSSLNYGSYLDENVLHLLEHFACPDQNPSSPIGKPDTASAVSPLLQNPIEGQMWFNKTNQRLYVLDNTSHWNPLKIPGDVASCSGIIAHGQQIPLPPGITSYSQCSYVVSPQYIDQEANYIACYADATGTVFMRYRPTNGAQLIDGLANYIIIGNDNSPAVHYDPVVSVTPTLTPAPFSTVTPTITPTPTLTPTSTITPVVSATAAVSPTATPSATPTVTPSPTPTYTVTPTVTRTATITPTPPVTPSAIISTSYIMTAISATSTYTSFGSVNIVEAGYLGAGSGALSSTTYQGYTIQFIECVAGSSVPAFFTFGLAGGVAPQNAFSQIQFVDKFGILRAFASSAATYVPQSSTNAYNTWRWGGLPGVIFDQSQQYIIVVYF